MNANASILTTLSRTKQRILLICTQSRYSIHPVPVQHWFRGTESWGDVWLTSQSRRVAHHGNCRTYTYASSIVLISLGKWKEERLYKVRRRSKKRMYKAAIKANSEGGVREEVEKKLWKSEVRLVSASLLLSDSSPMTQACLCVFRLISRMWLSRSESRLHPAPITRVGGKPLCLQATWAMMSTGPKKKKKKGTQEMREQRWGQPPPPRLPAFQHRPGCEAMTITASGLRRARCGMIPLYMSTLVWTTLTYDCSLLHALAVTTMTLEPAEAAKSRGGRTTGQICPATATAWGSAVAI